MNKRFEELKRKNNNRVNKVDEQLLEDGELFQDYVKMILKDHGEFIDFYKTEIFQNQKGEGPSGVEIKTDNRCTGSDGSKPTGRLSIEFLKYYKNSKGVYNWLGSGVMNHAKAKWYIQGNPDIFWVFDREFLEKLITLKKNSCNEYYFQRGEYIPKDQWYDNLTPKVNKITKNPLKKMYLPIEWADKFCICKYIIDDDNVTELSNSNYETYFLKLKNDLKEEEKELNKFVAELF